MLNLVASHDVSLVVLHKYLTHLYEVIYHDLIFTRLNIKIPHMHVTSVNWN